MTKARNYVFFVSTMDRAYLSKLILIASECLAHIHPCCDRATLYGLLSRECFIHGREFEGLAQIDTAYKYVDAESNPITKSAGLISIASAFVEAGKFKNAVSACRVASSILFGQNDLVSSLQESALAIVYSKIGEDKMSQEIASRIVFRGDRRSDILAKLSRAYAIRIYVYAGDLLNAEKNLCDCFYAAKELALLHSVYDLKQSSNSSARRRAIWIESHSLAHCVVLAVLMIWYSLEGSLGYVFRIWQSVKTAIESEKNNDERLRIASLACLALRNSNETTEAQRLFELIKGWRYEVGNNDLSSATREELARLFVAFGDLDYAISLNGQRRESTIDGILNSIIIQLIEDGNYNSPINIIENANDLIKARVLFNCVLKLLGRNACCSEKNLSDMERIAYKLNSTRQP